MAVTCVKVLIAGVLVAKLPSFYTCFTNITKVQAYMNKFFASKTFTSYFLVHTRRQKDSKMWVWLLCCFYLKKKSEING